MDRPSLGLTTRPVHAPAMAVPSGRRRPGMPCRPPRRRRVRRSRSARCLSPGCPPVLVLRGNLLVRPRERTGGGKGGEGPVRTLGLAGAVRVHANDRSSSARAPRSTPRPTAPSPEPCCRPEPERRSRSGREVVLEAVRGRLTLRSIRPRSVAVVAPGWRARGDRGALRRRAEGRLRRPGGATRAASRRQGAPGSPCPTGAGRPGLTGTGSLPWPHRRWCGRPQSEVGPGGAVTRSGRPFLRTVRVDRPIEGCAVGGDLGDRPMTASVGGARRARRRGPTAALGGGDRGDEDLAV